MLTPTEFFKKAEAYCVVHGFEKEIQWSENREPFEYVTKEVFLREYAWVVLNSGMKASVIEDKWEIISQAFLGFNPKAILASEDVECKALRVFGNRAKIKAILGMVKELELTELNFEISMKYQIKKNPLVALEKFPFIGPVTKYHLARNLGFDFVKPDRHLVRLAKRFDMTPFDLVEVIHKETGRRIGVIDYILWRFCEQTGATKKLPKGQTTLS